jgi:PAS domain S-box-containing protein
MRGTSGFSPSFDGLPDAIIASSLTGEILFLNQAAAQTFGLDREKTLGRDFLAAQVAELLTRQHEAPGP